MPKNIYIVGAQCTGKTTLVMALQDHFDVYRQTSQPQAIKEVARTVLKQHNFTASDITSSKAKALRLQQLILEAQYEAEKALGPCWFISDRSGLDPIIYTKRYVGQNEAMELMKTDVWHELKTHMSSSVIVVCEAGGNWLKDDGVRLMPEDMEGWKTLHDLFCQTLDEAHLEYAVLPHNITNLQERVAFVLSRWQI